MLLGSREGFPIWVLKSVFTRRGKEREGSPGRANSISKSLEAWRGSARFGEADRPACTTELAAAHWKPPACSATCDIE